MKKTVLTTIALVMALGGAVANASPVQVHKTNPYTDGALGTRKFDPYMDGSKAVKFDVYTDGAKLGKFDDPYDGNG